MQLAQLLFVHRAGAWVQQALARCVLGGNHIAQTLGTCHQHDKTVQPNGNAAVRWRRV